MKYIDFIVSECIREFNKEYDFSPAEFGFGDDRKFQDEFFFKLCR